MLQPLKTAATDSATDVTVPAYLVTVSEAVQALCQRGNVSWSEYKGLSLNGFERDALYPYLDVEALCNATEQIRTHCIPQRHFPPLTYDEALAHRLVPLLLERLREQAQQLEAGRSGR